LLVARAVLALVFIVAGITKLLDPSGTRKAMREFGVPQALTAPGAVLLPVVELGAAVALFPLVTAWYGAVACLALMLLFIGGIGVAMARGRRPDCHCFGQLYSSPIGWRTLARNAVLAAVAGFVVVAGYSSAGTDVLAWLGGDAVAPWVALGLGLGALIVSGVVVWLLLQLVAQSGRMLARMEGWSSESAKPELPLCRAERSSHPELACP
jgi:Methylamine utilisation protein MauE